MATPALPSSTDPSAAGIQNLQLPTSITESVASESQAQLPTQALATQIQEVTDPASFSSFLRMHRAVVVFFTDINCAPCRAIEPVLKRHAEEKGVGQSKRGVAFAKVEIGRAESAVAGQYGITATPAFLFFLNREKVCCILSVWKDRPSLLMTDWRS
jgi:desumoylating isopeptidase 1